MTKEELLKEFSLPENTDFDKLPVDEFRNHYQKLYIGRNVAADDEETVKKITGKYYGSANTALTGAFKEVGIELTPEEKKAASKLEDLVQVYKDKTLGLITSLKESASKGNDEKLTAKEKELAKIQNKLKETEEYLENEKKLRAKTEADMDSTIKSFKLNHALTAAKAKIPISETFNEYARKGFDVAFQEKYQIEPDENSEKLFLIDKKTGKKVNNKQGTDPALFEDVYTEELDKAGGLKKNNTAGGKQAPFTVQTNGNGNGQQNQNNGQIKMHPNFLKAAGQ